MNHVLAGCGIHHKRPGVQQQSSTMLLVKLPDLRGLSLNPANAHLASPYLHDTPESKKNFSGVCYAEAPDRLQIGDPR